MSTINASDIQLTTATVSGDLTVGSVNGSGFGSRNKIINGDMRIAQRGTSFVSAADAYTLDRWRWQDQVASPVRVTVSQDSDAPNDTFQYSYKVDVTTADASIETTDFALISQRIEGYNVRDLIGRTFTVSFWVKSPKTGVHCVAFRNDGADRSYVKEYTVDAANTWEYKSVTVTGGLITAGTWDWTNGIGLDLSFTLTSGTTFQTTADAWQTGNFIATSSQVNAVDSTANNFFLTGVQLEVGETASPFEFKSYRVEFADCQRYFQHFSGNSSGQPGLQWAGSTSTTNAYVSGAQFAVKMRDGPTMAWTTPTLSNVSDLVLSATRDGYTVKGDPTPSGWYTAFGGIITADAELEL
jgi:hypothetical protein